MTALGIVFDSYNFKTTPNTTPSGAIRAIQSMWTDVHQAVPNPILSGVVFVCCFAQPHTKSTTFIHWVGAGMAPFIKGELPTQFTFMP